MMAKTKQDWIFPLIALAALGFICHADKPLTAYGTTDNLDRVELFDGQSIKGRIESISDEGVLQGEGIPAGTELAQVIEIQLGDRPTFNDSKVIIHLINQSQVRCNRIRIQGEFLQVNSLLGIEQLPLQWVRGIVWKMTPDVERELRNPSSASDTVVVQTPDGERTITGLIEGFEEEQLSIQYQNQSRKINATRINALIMADLDLALNTAAQASLTTTDGSVLKGAIKSLQAGTVQFILDDDFVLPIPWNRVASIRFRSDRQVYLSDLDPIQVQQQTMFTVQRPWQKDRSVSRKPLTLRSASQELIEFQKGLGTQAFTQLDFANTADYQYFKATLGIAAETRGKGDCEMAVLGDGVELWSARVKGTDPPLEIEVNIGGVQVVSLVVRPGEEYDLADHANWCHARFVK